MSSSDDDKGYLDSHQSGICNEQTFDVAPVVDPATVNNATESRSRTSETLPGKGLRGNSARTISSCRLDAPNHTEAPAGKIQRHGMQKGLRLLQAKGQANAGVRFVVSNSQHLVGGQEQNNDTAITKNRQQKMAKFERRNGRTGSDQRGGDSAPSLRGQQKVAKLDAMRGRATSCRGGSPANAVGSDIGTEAANTDVEDPNSQELSQSDHGLQEASTVSAPGMPDPHSENLAVANLITESDQLRPQAEQVDYEQQEANRQSKQQAHTRRLCFFAVGGILVGVLAVVVVVFLGRKHEDSLDSSHESTEKRTTLEAHLQSLVSNISVEESFLDPA